MLYGEKGGEGMELLRRLGFGIGAILIVSMIALFFGWNGWTHRKPCWAGWVAAFILLVVVVYWFSYLFLAL